MSQTVGKVAYKAVWDASDLTKGLMNTRQQFAAKKKLLQSLRTPLDRYVQGLENLEGLTKKFPELARHRFKVEQDLEKQYLIESKAVRVLTDEERRRLKALTAGERAAAKKANQEKRNAEALQRTLANEERFHRRSIEIRKRAGQGAKLADQKRQQQERESVKLHRAALMRRLEDRKRHNVQMRQRIRESLRMVAEENRQMAAMQRSRNAGGAAGSAGAGAAALRIGSRVGAAVGVTFTAFQAADYVRDTAAMNRELERTSSALDVFTRSGSKSARMIQQIRDLSADTGVSFTAFNQGARTLLQFGTEADAVVDRMKRISIVTGGNAERMKALSLAVAQTTAASKLQGQELLQMVNAGWSPFEEISKRLNKSVPELRKMMEQGAISADMVTDALRAATEEGGRYHGFLEALEGTSARTYDRQSAAWEETGAMIGEAIEPLTRFKDRVSLLFAKDLQNLARPWIETKKAVEEVDKAEQRREERRKAVEAERKRVAEVFARQQAEANAERQMGLDSFAGMQRGLIGDLIGPEKSAEFERILSLLNDTHKEQATTDMIMFRDMDLVRRYLSDEVKLELQKLEALEKQAKAEAKKRDLQKEQKANREKMMADAEKIKADIATTEEKLGAELGRLIAMQRAGFLTADQFGTARDQAVNGAMSGRPSAPGRLGIRAGSSGAYDFFAQMQSRGFQKKQKNEEKSLLLQQAMVTALEKAEGYLEEIADNPVGNAG